jgi:deoxyribose-phosphate aldolase
MNDISVRCSEIISYNRPLKSVENLKLLYSCLDLTNLNSNAQIQDIKNLCSKATNSLYQGIEIPQVAAICIYPLYIPLCKELLQGYNINIACVSAAFPHSQTFSEVKYFETELALKHGATEIDIVLNLSTFLNKDSSKAFDEIKTIKQICGNNHLKVILETDLLKSADLIHEASFMALEAGADFIKTSTGKDGSVASLEAVYMMCEVIESFFQKTNFRAGIKPAGGISTTDDALNYMAVVTEILGSKFVSPSFFRIGASRLADRLLSDIAEIS